MEEQSSLLEPQLRRSAEIYPPKTLWESYGGNIWDIESEAFMPKGAGLFSLKGTSCHALWRKLAADWRATIVQFYLHVQYGFMVAFMIRCHSHTTTHPLQPFGCTSVSFAGSLFSLVFGNTTLKPRVPLTQLHWRVLFSLACCCCCSCRWVACVAMTQVGATHPPVSWDFHFPDRVTIDSLPLQRLRCIDAVASLVVELCPLQVRRFIAGTLDAANSQMYK